MTRAHWMAQHPGVAWLSADRATVALSLERLGWLEPGEQVQAVAALPEARTNLTLRVATNRRSLILKQARPWVESDDRVAAPWERAEHEAGFYQRVAGLPRVARRMPVLLGYDPRARLMLLQDLGPVDTYCDLYRGAELPLDDLADLASYLRELHDGTHDEPDPALGNRNMRQWMQERVYRDPLDEDQSPELESREPGLCVAAAGLRRDRALVQRLHDSGQEFMENGNCLLHGDYTPASWLRTSAGPRVIDPEFCGYGLRDVDVASAVAHLVLANGACCVPRFLDCYGVNWLNLRRLARFAGAQIIRHLLGPEQLPIRPTTGRRAILLQRSRHALLDEDLEPLCRA